MSSSYFRNLPNFEYVNRLPNGKSIGDFINVKNLFKRAKITDQIFSDATFFLKYKIIGDTRPDQVANEVYGDSNLDWIVLLSNNILNIFTEWPLTQQDFDTYLLNTYGSYEQIYAIKHYETERVINSLGFTIIEPGQIVPENFSVTFYDSGLGTEVIASQITDPVTNYDYESRLQDEKRNIYLLKPEYIQTVFDNLGEFLPYKKGGTQYVSPTLKKADDIKLYSDY